MSLSERIRPDVEAAPWVIAEIAVLEAENARYREALERIALGQYSAAGAKDIAAIALKDVQG